MIYRKDEEIIKLVERFEGCAVTRAEWTHAAHLTVALWYLRRYDFATAKAKMRDGIFKLLASFGVDLSQETPYHETLTVFWLRTVFAYLEKSRNTDSLVALTNGLIQTCSDSGLPLKFYSRELLFSPEARATYVEPNFKNHAQIL